MTEWEFNMRRRFARFGASGAATIMVLSFGAGTSFADDDSNVSETGSALLMLAENSSKPERNVLNDSVDVSVVLESEGDGDEYAQVDGDTAKIPTTTKDPIILGADSELPFAVTVGNVRDIAVEGEEIIDGVIGYNHGDGSVTVAVPKEDGSVQVAIVISEAVAPTDYEFSLGSSTNRELREYQDGSIGVYTNDGSFVGGIAAPWAIDANGIEVPTHFEVQGAKVVQVVDHRGANYAYPIVADPWLGKALITKTKWDKKILRVYPTSWAVCKHWYSVCAGTGARWAAWDEVKAKTPGTRENTTSMRDQLYCHFDVVRFVAPNKVSWNLDEGRPSVSYATMLKRQCNL